MFTGIVDQNKMKMIVLILGVMVVCSCTNRFFAEVPDCPEIANFSIGKWVNIHKNNPDLVGVRVQQFPDCEFDAMRYEGKHPAMVIFVMRNGKVHQLDYDPDGRVTSGFWWDAPTNHWIWEGLDRNPPKE